MLMYVLMYGPTPKGAFLSFSLRSYSKKDDCSQAEEFENLRGNNKPERPRKDQAVLRIEKINTEYQRRT